MRTILLLTLLDSTASVTRTELIYPAVGFVVQDLMKGAPETPNVVEACNLEGRQERLDGLLGQLEMCEKALQV